MRPAPRKVHQLLAAFHAGDAVGNEALAIQSHLRSAGYESEVFAAWADPRLAGRARRLEEYQEFSGPETVCLFHFAAGSPAGRLIYGVPDRLVVIYHNLTPARFFVGFSGELVRLCHQGRRELAAFAARTELGLGVSEFNRRELEAAGFRRTDVLPFVHDLASYQRPASAVTRRLLEDGRTNILFVGRVVPNKKLEDLLRVFAFYQRYLDARSRLLLVGDHRGQEPYLRRLTEMARELRLDEVVLAGHVEDDELLACYGSADVFLCLSEHEGYGVPLVEAMILGVPVAAYDAAAVRETLRGGGVLLQEKRPEVVAELVHRLVRDRAFRKAVLGAQEQALAELRRTDFGALLRQRLAPVLEGS